MTCDRGTPARMLIAGYQKHERLILGTLGFISLAAIWELAVQYGLLSRVVASSPSLIASAFSRQLTSGAIVDDLRLFALELTIGFGLAFIIGTCLGVAMGINRVVEYAADPFVWLVYSSPTIAFYPLLIIWLGFGSATVVAVTFLLTFVAIVVNTMAGVRAADPQLMRAVRAFGGSQRDVIFKVILPSSLPLILAGIRIGLGRAFLGVILGEMFSSNAGFGYHIAYYASQLETSDVFVSIIVLIALGMLIHQVSSAVEARLLGWRESRVT
jgi:NitT/TauT family transport system permease protein